MPDRQIAMDDEECAIIYDTLFLGEPIVIKSTADYDDNGEFTGNVIYDESSLTLLKAMINFIHLRKPAKIGHFSEVFIFEKLKPAEQQKILNLPVTIVTRY